jgi:acyl transferase domain-containing protein
VPAALPGSKACWKTQLVADAVPGLADCRLQGKAFLPASAYIEMALAALMQARPGTNSLALQDVRFEELLFLENKQARTLQLTLDLDPPEKGTFRICSGKADAAAARWIEHMRATVRGPHAAGTPGPGAEDQRAIRVRCHEELSVKEHYASLRARGIEYGPSFRAVRAVFCGNNEAFGELALPKEAAAEAGMYHFHPVLLDGCLQLLAAAGSKVAGGTPGETYLPVAVDFLWVRNCAARSCNAHIKVGDSVENVPDSLIAEIRVFSGEEELVAILSGVRLRRVEPARAEPLGYEPTTGEHEQQPLQRIRLAAPGDRIRLLTTYLRRELAGQLRTTDAALAETISILLLGMDSLTALKLQHRVQLDFGIQLSLGRLLQGPSIVQLATEVSDYLSEIRPGGHVWERGIDPARAAHLLAHFDELSSGDVESLLGQMLASETRGSDEQS